MRRLDSRTHVDSPFPTPEDQQRLNEWSVISVFRIGATTDAMLVYYRDDGFARQSLIKRIVPARRQQSSDEGALRGGN